jgi:hypothetical protein
VFCGDIYCFRGKKSRGLTSVKWNDAYFFHIIVINYTAWMKFFTTRTTVFSIFCEEVKPVILNRLMRRYPSLLYYRS